MYERLSAWLDTNLNGGQTAELMEILDEIAAAHRSGTCGRIVLLLESKLPPSLRRPRAPLPGPRSGPERIS